MWEGSTSDRKLREANSLVTFVCSQKMARVGGGGGPISKNVAADKTAGGYGKVALVASTSLETGSLFHGKQFSDIP